jgi:two-component system response regulator AtoC
MDADGLVDAASAQASLPAERLPWVAHEPASRRLLELARKLAETFTTVLITGESGTGKDYLARLIHELGPRRDAPFLKIDCASLPQELVESELFGHERGSFTGAAERKLGRFELAGKGTLVLDEVAALSPGAQAKLLRVLEERTFERLGGGETLRIEARLIALTNADLPKALAAGRFREDLFFRLNVVALHVPPLRERRADLLPLADRIFAGLRATHGRPNAVLSPATRVALTAYAWPGNIRELRHALERALIFSPSDLIEPAAFSEAIRTAAAGVPGPLASLRSLGDLEREAIAATLEATRYKISKAADILGISRKTLLDKRKRYGLK